MQELGEEAPEGFFQKESGQNGPRPAREGEDVWQKEHRILSMETQA